MNCQIEITHAKRVNERGHSSTAPRPHGPAPRVRRERLKGRQAQIRDARRPRSRRARGRKSFPPFWPALPATNHGLRAMRAEKARADHDAARVGDTP
jgi:hypothetical protein